MLFSPRSLLSCVVAGIILSSTANAAALQPRQSGAATTTTCAYTWSCDTANGYNQQSDPATSDSATPRLRCTRRADYPGANGVGTSCYYPNNGTPGGNPTTGEGSTVLTSPGTNTAQCPTNAMRSTTESSCTTMRRRALNLSPNWAVSRQAVVRKGKVVPQSSAAAEDAKATGIYAARKWQGRK